MLKLEPRPELSRFWTFASPILALLITVLIGVVLFAALGKDPIKGLMVFFYEPVKNGYALGELMGEAQACFSVCRTLPMKSLSAAAFLPT